MSAIEEAVLAKLRALPLEQQREVLDFATLLGSGQEPGKAMKSARGLWKDLGIRISAEEIAEARKQMWANFPREEFFE